MNADPRQGTHKVPGPAAPASETGHTPMMQRLEREVWRGFPAGTSENYAKTYALF